MYDIITIGDIKLDAFIRITNADIKTIRQTEKLCIDYGKKNPVQGIDLQIAGSAPNVAIGLAKMKKTSAVYSEMGKDITHDMSLQFLKKHGVDPKLVKSSNEDSGFAAVLNYKGESTQLVKQSSAIYRLPKKFPRTSWIHLSELGAGYQALYKDIIKEQKKKGFSISFNPGVIQIKERKREFFNILKVTDVLFVNKAEAIQLAKAKKTTKIGQIMRKLYDLGPKHIVVTDGRDGAYAYNGEELVFAPMFPGRRVEATGAGDSFTTGFLGALMHGKDDGEGLKWGSVNAATVVQHVGPTKGLLTHSQIKKQLKEKPRYKTTIL